MTLSVQDIVDDLGVSKVTVRRWFTEGQIKGIMPSRRTGWRFEESEYEAFLDKHPEWRKIHEGELYNKRELEVRDKALLNISAQLIAIKMRMKAEGRSIDYAKGFERAISDIQTAINNEINKKWPG